MPGTRGVLVDDGQTLDLLAIGAGVEHEVIGPDQVGAGRRQRPRPAGGNASPRPPARQLQPGLPPQAMGTMPSPGVALAPQEDADAPVAIARILRGQRAHGVDDWGVLGRQPQLVAQAGAAISSSRRRGASTDRVGRRTQSARAAPAGSPLSAVDVLQDFDVQIALGQQLLQPRVLGLERLQALDVGRRQTAEVLTPVVDVCSLTLFFRATSATELRSASRRIPTICSSVNRLFFIGSSLTKSHLSRNHWSEETGAGQNDRAWLAIQYNPDNSRPTFHFPDGVVHALALEQRSGITAKRQHDILQELGYFDDAGD